MRRNRLDAVSGDRPRLVEDRQPVILVAFRGEDGEAGRGPLLSGANEIGVIRVEVRDQDGSRRAIEELAFSHVDHERLIDEEARVARVIGRGLFDLAAGAEDR